MRRTPRWLLLLPWMLVLGCASSIRLIDETTPADLTSLRAEYFAQNPDSPYRDQISAGKVVRGMDALGVIASWGRPERRVRDEAGFEKWVYVDADRDTGDRVEYELAFHDGTLARWQMRVHALGSEALRDSEKTRLSAPPADVPSGKRVPQN